MSYDWPILSGNPRSSRFFCGCLRFSLYRFTKHKATIERHRFDRNGIPFAITVRPGSTNFCPKTTLFLTTILYSVGNMIYIMCWFIVHKHLNNLAYKRAPTHYTPGF